jgi:hypothetical protein
VERIGRSYRYRFTDQGIKSRTVFHHRPDENLKPACKVEAAYYKG